MLPRGFLMHFSMNLFPLRRAAGLAARVGACLIAALLATPTLAQVYKCTEPGGKTSYQAQPCADAAKGAELDLRWTASATSSPLISAGSLESGQVTITDLRLAIIQSCNSSVSSQGDATLRRIVAKEPSRLIAFCDCVAERSLVDVAGLKRMAMAGDRNGLKQLGLKAGLACAARLQ
jgi:hypothetical protein